MSETSIPIVKYAANTQPFTVLIEGNIGSGKSTFLNHFQKYQDAICILPEPIEKWLNFKGDNLLDCMYSDITRFGSIFQLYVNLTMLQNHILQTNKPIKMMERSIYSSKYCFVENMHRNGIVNTPTYNVLQSWYEFIETTVELRVDLIVYLRTSPAVVCERMRKRNRNEESGVDMSYLNKLHELHEDWLIKNKAYNTPVIVLDANLDMDQIGYEYKRCESYINQTSNVNESSFGKLQI